MGVKVNQRALERREEGNNDTENERWVSTFHTFQRWTLFVFATSFISIIMAGHKYPVMSLHN